MCCCGEISETGNRKMTIVTSPVECALHRIWLDAAPYEKNLWKNYASSSCSLPRYVLDHKFVYHLEPPLSLVPRVLSQNAAFHICIVRIVALQYLKRRCGYCRRSGTRTIQTRGFPSRSHGTLLGPQITSLLADYNNACSRELR